MAKHLVKCLVCGQTFDANVEPYKMKGRRYIHLNCKLDEDKDKLINYIKQLFNYDVLPAKVNRQLQKYIKENAYTYSGIYDALVYWYEVKHGDIEKANGGIGIVEYIYEESHKYWQSIEEAKIRNQNAKEIEITKVEVHISAPKRQPMKQYRKQFTFLEDENEQ